MPLKVVCITGAASFIGGHIVEEFLKNGVDVRGTVRDPKATKNQFLYDLETQYKGSGGGKLTLFAADLNAPGAFDEAVAGCEVVVHVAAVTAMTYKKDPYEEIINPTVNGVKNVVGSCLKHGVKRIVYTSSVATINCAENHRPLSQRGKPFTEDMWNTHVTPTYGTYNYSKIEAEKELMKLWKGELISLLPPYVFGPQQNPVITSSMQLVRALANKEYKFAIPLYGDWVDVRDVARAHYFGATSTTVASGRYNVTQNTSLCLADYGEAINKAFPEIGAPTKTVPWAVLWAGSWFDRRISTFMLYERATKMSPMDNSRIQQQGFQFVHNDLVETMRDAVASMRKFGIVKN
jgi:nucleoside-diphosphate-sugar epimerase